MGIGRVPGFAQSLAGVHTFAKCRIHGVKKTGIHQVVRVKKAESVVVFRKGRGKELTERIPFAFHGAVHLKMRAPADRAISSVRSVQLLIST